MQTCGEERKKSCQIHSHRVSRLYKSICLILPSTKNHSWMPTICLCFREAGSDKLQQGFQGCRYLDNLAWLAMLSDALGDANIRNLPSNRLNIPSLANFTRLTVLFSSCADKHPNSLESIICNHCQPHAEVLLQQPHLILARLALQVDHQGLPQIMYQWLY